MVEIRPFKGLRYNKEKIKDFGLVITPPYDVIDEKEKNEFYILSEYNLVRLILNKDHADAARRFEEWQKNDILKEDSEDSAYVYSQEFEHNGKKLIRTGFISLLRLEAPGKGVLPHEKTLDKPFSDRLSLLAQTKANFGFIFMLYEDAKKKIDQLMEDKIRGKSPDMAFSDRSKGMHKVWKISDQGFIKCIKEEMSRQQCVIADGHHRYRSALKFAEDHPELENAKYTMCSFVNSFNEGLLVLPIDRFIFNLKDIDINNTLSLIEKNFIVEQVHDMDTLIKRIDDVHKENIRDTKKKNVFGMYYFLNKRYYCLQLKNADVLDAYYADKTQEYRRLDVSILHKLIFKDVFGISEEDQAKEIYIEYTKGNKRALDKLGNPKYQFAFFVNPPLLKEIFLTAKAGETMPQKSTYFYPKLYSGVVINKIG